MFKNPALVKRLGPLDKKGNILYNFMVLCQDSVIGTEFLQRIYGRESHGMQGQE